jgi:hypothetical protein
MDTEELFTFARTRVLHTRAYRGIPGFLEEVEKLSALSGLIFWLGNTPFPPRSPWRGCGNERATHHPHRLQSRHLASAPGVSAKNLLECSGS